MQPTPSQASRWQVPRTAPSCQGTSSPRSRQGGSCRTFADGSGSRSFHSGQGHRPVTSCQHRRNHLLLSAQSSAFQSGISLLSVFSGLFPQSYSIICKIQRKREKNCSDDEFVSIIDQGFFEVRPICAHISLAFFDGGQFGTNYIKICSFQDFILILQ